ncbi:hypothetical protein [Vibrio sp. D431a]|uniref:hypothetical protein n=1 Tax=Vibrio sp. D431a TaxID=2837388 RepID=UPI0025577C96|nr:hypothetical protein [Vibrio sp. D431a]MDK9793793.1 hypothetical protein [Vibrio sp. D431a]
MYDYFKELSTFWQTATAFAYFIHFQYVFWLLLNKVKFSETKMLHKIGIVLCSPSLLAIKLVTNVILKVFNKQKTQAKH